MTQPKSFSKKTQKQTEAQFLTPDKTLLPIISFPLEGFEGLNPIHISPFKFISSTFR